MGSRGHCVVPILDEALQKWVEYTGKSVTYVMKGMNCRTEMYSALGAEVPISSDPTTQLDEKFVADLNTADKVLFSSF
jgi:hypothetical protein